MAIEITDALVAHIARLSRLGLSPAEAAALKGHFQKILQYVQALDKLDVSGIDPSFFPLSTSNVLSDDEPGPSLGTEGALLNAPASRGGYFLVPRIVAEAPGGKAGAAGGTEEEEESA
jgi:aspartyl-tRNA(Asn)/glutamyl-tRNA(Gln) amidotransferase subunit C